VNQGDNQRSGQTCYARAAIAFGELEFIVLYGAFLRRITLSEGLANINRVNRLAPSARSWGFASSLLVWLLVDTKWPQQDWLQKSVGSV